MNYADMIVYELEKENPNQLIFANSFYQIHLQEDVTEASYYKTLERLCAYGELLKVAKGVYCRPKKTRYGLVPPSEEDIINSFTKDESGTVIGYTLYNRLQLTTQIGNKTEVLTSKIDGQKKTIGNVVLQFCQLRYTDEIIEAISMMEVLQNFSVIQDMNMNVFLKYTQRFAERYHEEAFEDVCAAIRYKKRTIAFLKSNLEYYGIKNNLGRHLSTLSEYQYPKMEELYETA